MIGTNEGCEVLPGYEMVSGVPLSAITEVSNPVILPLYLLKCKGGALTSTTEFLWGQHICVDGETV